MNDKCSTHGCTEEAAYYYCWPGCPVRYACWFHALKIEHIADAMGFFLPMSRLDDSVPLFDVLKRTYAQPVEPSNAEPGPPAIEPDADKPDAKPAPCGPEDGLTQQERDLLMEG